MKTFFAQVQDPEIERLADEAADRVAEDCDRHRLPDPADVAASERDSLVFWIGADTVGQVPTVAILVERLKPYAEIAPEMIETLRADQRSAEAQPRNGHERAMQQLVIGNSLR
jgi:hypothetical protein